MALLRQFLILALVPITAWGGMPHLACRCSSGEVRVFCSRMGQQSKDRVQVACSSDSSSRERKPCCRGNGALCCTSSTSSSGLQGSECCASGCRCTPVYLQGDAGTTLKKVALPELVQLDLPATSIAQIQLPRIVKVDLGTLRFQPRVPDDLIVLCERWLI
ncbi:MAG: hypothetical protein JWP89_5791 [Schlesneria sp.]|nr:hypothetical protein [Schlesneria sp.]